MSEHDEGHQPDEMDLSRWDREDREDEMREAGIEAKRQAAGTSPEVLSMLDAAAQGRKAGFLGLGPNSNPFQDFTPEHAEWEKHRHAAIGAKLNNPMMRRNAA